MSSPLLILLVVLPVSLMLWFVNVFINKTNQETDFLHALSPWRWLTAVLVPVLMAKHGTSSGSLSVSGALAGMLVGFIVTLSNYCFLGALLAFFISASKATKFRSDKKKKFEDNFKEGGQRNWLQVVCNGGVATLLAFIYMIDGGCGERTIDFSHSYATSWLCMALLGAICCCSGDTYSSEIGSAVGSGSPRLITTLRKVPRGTNGGISFVGTLASGIGGLIVGIVYYTVLILCASRHQLAVAPPQWPIVIVGALAGLAGSLIDSFLGATFQFSGINRKTQKIVETPGPDVDAICGSAVLDNHGVNLLSSIITALVTPQIGIAVWGYVM